MADLPGLLALWHDGLNEVAAAEQAVGSTHKAWWRCPAGEDHQWEAAVQSVRNAVGAGSSGCPYCRGLRASSTNSVAGLMPEAAARWDHERNGCGPEDVVAGSNKKVGWRCHAGPDHRWDAAPVSRSGCPFCAGRRVSVTNRLDLLHPDLAAEWHPDLNDGLAPPKVVAGSHLKVWWRCVSDPRHEWKAGVVQRTSRGAGCPYCSGTRATAEHNVAASWPQVAALWHPELNGAVRPADVTPASDRVCWWKCPVADDHQWQAAAKTVVIAAKSGTTGCPACSGRQASVTNSVAAHPTLSRQWHPTLNLPLLPETTVAGTSRQVWWQCETDPDHVWDATGANRTRDRGCPWCKEHHRGALELCLAYELQTLISGIDLNADKVQVGPRRLLAVDILLPAERVAIEVDGRYRHANREEQDAAKTARLRDAGWRVLRVREHPLGALSEHDVVVPQDPGVKITTDVVLCRLRDLGWASPEGLDAYFAEPDPRRQAEALADLSRQRGGAKVREPGREKGPNRPQRWETKYALLVAYAAREGHARPPESHLEDGQKLGTWAAQQRARYRRGELEPDRAERLALLPGWPWDPLADGFDLRYRLLLDWVSRHGHAYVPVQHVEQDIGLGWWIKGLQTGRGRTTLEQRRLLDVLPGWTWDRRAYVRDAGQGQSALF